MAFKTQEQIIAEIEAYIRSQSIVPNFLWTLFVGYNDWYCGVTQNKAQNQTRHKRPERHKFWVCPNPTIARDIERYFHKKGMKGASGGGTDTRYVYVY